MAPFSSKATFLCGAIMIGAATSTYALADKVYNKADQYEYTAPPFGEIRSIKVTLVGGGGGGAGGDAADGWGVVRHPLVGITSGGGGGGGAVKTCYFYPPSMSNKVLAIKINVGAGGKGGAGGTSYNSGNGKTGGNGGDSSITTINTRTASRDPVYGSQSGVMAAGGTGAIGTPDKPSDREDIRKGGVGGGLRVECKEPDAIPVSSEAGLSGQDGTLDAPGLGAEGRLLTACMGAGAGGKGGLMGAKARQSFHQDIPVPPADSGGDGTDGCVILELVKF